MEERKGRFEAVYRATYDQILGYAVRRCDSPEDAADVVAETFAIAWRRVERLPEGDEARLWLYGVARNFRAVGLTVSLQLQPSSPHGVGEIFQVGSEGGAGQRQAFDAEPAGCAITAPECTLVLRMSVGSAGLWIKAGRPAKPGEAYQDHARSAAKDGQLAGAKVYERTVGEVLSEIEKRGLTATYLIIEPNANLEGFGVDPNQQSTPVGPGWVVWDAEDAQAGVVRLLVTEKRYAKNPVYGDGSPPGE